MGTVRKKPGNGNGINTAFMRGAAFNPGARLSAEKVGVLFAVHGGFSQYSRQYLWDASMQMFSYEPNHAVYTVWHVVSICLADCFKYRAMLQKKYQNMHFHMGVLGGLIRFRC